MTREPQPDPWADYDPEKHAYKPPPPHDGPGIPYTARNVVWVPGAGDGSVRPSTGACGDEQGERDQVRAPDEQQGSGDETEESDDE